MQIKETIGERMLKKAPRSYKYLNDILDKPALHIGVWRFDYLEVLLNGYNYANYESSQRCNNTYDSLEVFPNALLQYWLLHTESATLHSGTMLASSLYYRCFGSQVTAFRKYREFLAARLPEDPDCVDLELNGLETQSGLLKMKSGKDDLESHKRRLAATLISIIEELISNASYVADDLKIYVRREPLFKQLRFLFHTANGWIDDSEIILNQKSHYALIKLHTILRNEALDNLKDFGCDVFDEIEFSNDKVKCEVSDIAHLITDENTFHFEYMRWREFVLKQGV